MLFHCHYYVFKVIYCINNNSTRCSKITKILLVILCKNCSMALSPDNYSTNCKVRTAFKFTASYKVTAPYKGSIITLFLLIQNYAIIVQFMDIHE